ncbi:MAG: serine hydrolase domain-containing protein [Rectinemataceae bacterium]|nr:serine hydrolase domain-containing protein [Rectinemataceae bacterium]
MSEDQLTGAINAIAEGALSRKLAAGLVVRIERVGQPMFEHAYGYALLAANRHDPMAVSTKFDLASLTKLFTTTAALHLVTLKKLALDTALCDIAYTARMSSGHPLLEKAFSTITVRKLMTHSSGLHYWYPFYAAGGGDFASIMESVLERFPLGSEIVYSDLNYMLLGKIVENASGYPQEAALKAALRDIVCGPLKLADTGYKLERGPFAATEFGNRIEKKMVEDLGLVFSGWRPDGIPFVGEPDDGNCHYFFGGVAGHAGILSTARDLCALGKVYLDTNGHKGFLSPSLVAEAGQDQGGNRGLGFQLGEHYPGGGFGHTGFTGTYLYLNREAQCAVAVLANRLHVEAPQNINELRKELVLAALCDR